MPVWAVIQIGLLVIWLFFAFMFYYYKGWQTGFPIKRDQIINLIFLRIVPILWMSSSLILGVVYVLFKTNSLGDLIQICSTIVIPIIVLFFIFYNVRKLDRKKYEAEKRELQEIKEKRDNSIKWVNQFQFITKENFDLKVYISKGRPAGMLTIYNMNEEQRNVLNQNRAKLPEGIYLDILPDKISNNIHH